MRTRRPRVRSTATLLLALLLASAGALAEDRPAPRPTLTPTTIDALRRLHLAALQSDYAYHQVEHLADHIGPRFDGSPQHEAATAYVADELRKLGFAVRLEKVRTPHWVRGDERAELVAYAGQPKGISQKVVVTALGRSASTSPDGITADVLVVEGLDALQALGRERIAGRIVLFDRAFDRRMAEGGAAWTAYEEVAGYRRRGPDEAMRLGAVAALVRSAGGGAFRLPHAGSTFFSEGIGIPAAAITAEDADLIARLAPQGSVRMHLTLTPRTLPDIETSNVVADLEGAEHPEQIVIVSAHLDSWDLGTGAIDDAAGVGIAMEAARLVKQLGLRPRRTIRFVAWTAEEFGLLGSKAYVRDHRAELAQHQAAIESDVGAGHAMGFAVRAGPGAMLALEPVAEVLHGSGASMVRTIDGPLSSDLDVLADEGVPTLSPVVDSRRYFDWHHTAADTLDKIDLRELRENAAVVAVLTYALAAMDGALPRASTGGAE